LPNQSLHPIAAHWVAPGELFDGAGTIKEEYISVSAVSSLPLIQRSRMENDDQRQTKKGPTTTFSRTLPDSTVHSIELPAPSSITMRKVLVLEPGNLAEEKDVLQLMAMMFNNPEVDYEHYSEYQKPKDTALNQAIDRGDIILVELQCYYYRHPEDKGSFIRINPTERDLFDWESDLVSHGPSFVRNILRLSERKKREYETWQKIEMEEVFKKRKQAVAFSNDIFLSYNDKDHLVANSIREKLLKAGAKVFMAPKSLVAGDDFADKIRNALLSSSELWVIVSQNSLGSEWVTTEWGAAWVLSKRIVPILHRCDIPQLPDRLKRLHCIDVDSIADLIQKRFGKSDESSS
jgi:hypothetical protein